ncbi:MAG: ABC transporter substrate-binding protein [Cyanobacteria bacterium J06598_3]
MAKRSAHPMATAAVIVAIPLLLGGFWWLNGRIQLADKSAGTSGTGQPADPVDGTIRLLQPPNTNPEGADGRAGASVLPGELSIPKRKGLEALAAGDYDGAQRQFSAALKASRNDPETRIYLNNAKIGEGPAYVIAASMPVGEVLAPSLELMRGVAHAQEQVNTEGGIQGTPLKVLLFDDRGDTATAKTIAAGLVADKRVLGVVGHYSSDTSLAAATVYEPGQLTMVSPISTAVKFSKAGNHIFRTVPSDALAAKTLASHALETGKKSVAIFYTGESTYSKSIHTEFITAFANKGGRISAEFDVSSPAFNPQSAILEAQEQGADVLMLALTIDTSDTSLAILRANEGTLPLVGGDDLYDSKILQEGQQNALGLTVAVPWHIQNHLESDFVAQSRQLWGGDVNWRTVTAYDAAMALVEGIRDVSTRSGVAYGLSRAAFRAEGATNDVAFTVTGDRDQPSQLVEVVRGDRSGSGYDYMPVQSTP